MPFLSNCTNKKAFYCQTGLGRLICFLLKKEPESAFFTVPAPAPGYIVSRLRLRVKCAGSGSAPLHRKNIFHHCFNLWVGSALDRELGTALELGGGKPVFKWRFLPCIVHRHNAKFCQTWRQPTPAPLPPVPRPCY